MSDAAGGELSRPLRYGEQLGVEIAGPRRCIGIWRGDARRCPFDSQIDAGLGTAQCSPCAAADPGRALARDATVDSRPFRLYLATFGAGVVKVGISAVDRDTERLLEQGALAFTWIAEGSHPAIRAAESAVAATGMAIERLRRTTKLAGWWQQGDPGERRDTLLAVAAAAHRLSSWPAGVRRFAVDVVDHADLYALGDLPDHVDIVDQLAAGAVLVGRVRTVIGPEILLDNPSGSGPDRGLVVGGRTLAGWPVVPAQSTGGGYTVRTIQQSDEQQTDGVADAVQHALF